MDPRCGIDKNPKKLIGTVVAGTVPIYDRVVIENDLHACRRAIISIEP
jgi:hypothetical protein